MSELSNNGAEILQNYEILQNEQVGRYLVAAKDLEEGDTILVEEPFVVGPKAFTYPLCLSCYSAWPRLPQTHTLCSRCKWPVCGEECENHPHHKDYECQVFVEAREKFNTAIALNEELQTGVPQLECITPLRLLLASEKDPERWEKQVQKMEAHNKKRHGNCQWKADQVNIVDYIRNRLKLTKFSEEAIQTVCGILQINTHEVRTSKGYPARALYPQFSLMNHSCVSNTSHGVSPTDYKVYLRTTVKVPKGGELYGSYTHSLLPTMLRREQLYEGKHFSCACNRCSDPTELGTHMSSLKCSKCDNGIVVPLDSLDSESSWKCTHCEFITTGAAVLKVFRIMQSEVEAAEMLGGPDGPESIQQRETVIKKYHSVLHPHHAFLTMLRYSLVQMYGRVDEYLLTDLPDVVLEHKAEMCRLLLQVLDVVEPGCSRARGMVLYELHAPLLILARGQWQAGVIDTNILKSKTTEAANILKESIRILCMEPSDTPEGQLGEESKPSLAELEKSISEL